MVDNPEHMIYDIETVALNKCDVGDIATCKRGQVGLITKITPDGIYKGIHLSKQKFGKSWQSKVPELITNFFNLDFEGISLEHYIPAIQK